MQNNLVLITGGTGYLGTAVTRELQKRGYTVAALSRNAPDFSCDVTDFSSVNLAVEKAVAKYGAIKAVIHAAAPKLERVPSVEASAQSARQQHAVALLGAKNLYEAAKP